MRFFTIFWISMITGGVLYGQDYYSLDSLHVIRITFEQQHWDHILDSLKQEDAGGRLTAVVDIDGVTYNQVGVRYKGNSSYYAVRRDSLTKLPFNIKLNHEVKGQKLAGGFGTLKLSNVFRDPSFLREVLAYEIAREYMIAPRANYSHVYVNEEYYGLYNSSESVDDTFLKAHFGYDDGVLIKCDPIWKQEHVEGCPEGEAASLMYLGEDSLCYMRLYEMKSDQGWADLIDLTRTLEKEPEKIEKMLDVDQTLWMLAFDNLLVNLDSYIGKLCHNYYLYRDSMGCFHPIVWDMNMAFGGFTFSGLEEKPLSAREMQRLSPLLHLKEHNEKRPLINILLNNSLYRKIYLAHTRTILEEQILSGRYMERGKKIQQMIDSLVQQDENRLYPYGAFKFNFEHDAQAGKVMIAGITDLMEGRKVYLQNHPLLKAAPPRIVEAQNEIGAEEYAITAQVEDAEQVWLCYRFGEIGTFDRIKMMDNGEAQDSLAEDGIWSVSLPKKAGLQYYLIAENKAAASLLPRRASRQFFTIPSDLKTAE